MLHKTNLDHAVEFNKETEEYNKKWEYERARIEYGIAYMHARNDGPETILEKIPCCCPDCGSSELVMYSSSKVYLFDGKLIAMEGRRHCDEESPIVCDRCSWEGQVKDLKGFVEEVGRKLDSANLEKTLAAIGGQPID